MDNVFHIDYHDKQIILIATAHVSKDSVELVRQVVQEEQPDSICIELDKGRYKSIQNPKQWESTDIIDVIKSKRTGYLLANLALSAYQKKIAKQLNTAVGQEMIQGIVSARETGAQLVLADRNIQTTFLRIWCKLGFFEKCKLLFSLAFSFDNDNSITDEDLQQILKSDILESMLADMRKQFPKIGHILISERDQHLAAKIKEAQGPKIVAVLGGAHVPGVKEEIFKEQNLREITTVPPKSKASKAVAWAIPIGILLLMAYGFLTSVQTGMQQVTAWMLWNSGLAALFTLVALAHPLTILTAFVTAPFTSLNPLLACGWFAGLVEATIRKPTVKDLSNATTDITSVRGFLKNRFLRTLLIVLMANIGSSLGTYIAGAGMVRSLL